MSWFKSNDTITNKSVIPAGISKESAVKLLHDHDFFIRCDPHYVVHKTLPQPSGAVEADLNAAKKHFKLPDHLTSAKAGLTPQGVPIVKLYEVTDDLPNKFWKGAVVSSHELVDLADGLWTRVKSPMGVTLSTTWQIVPLPDGTLEIVQDIVIEANSMIIGFVKSTIESNRGGIHKKMIARLTADRDGVAAVEGDGGEGAPAPAAA